MLPVGRPLLALLLVATAVASQPSSVDEAAQRATSQGLAALSRGDLQGAEASFEEALDRTPNHVPALLGLSQLQEKSGDLMAALETARGAERIAPERLGPVLTVGRLLNRLGAREESLVTMRRALEIDPDNPASILMAAVGLRFSNRPAEAIELLESAIDRNLRAPAIVEQLGYLLLSQEEVARALALTEPAAIAAPDRAGLALVTGMALASTPERRSEAVEWLEKALELGVSNQVRARMELGNLLIEANRNSEALAHLQTAAAMAPEAAEVQYRLGAALMQLGFREEAQVVLENYERLHEKQSEKQSGTKDTGVLLNEVETLATQDRFEEALAKLDRLEVEKGDLPRALLLRSEILYADRRLEDALEPADRLSKLQPAIPHGHYLVGLLLFELQRFDEAEAALRRVVSLKTSHAEAHRLLGRTLTARKRPEEAVFHFERALELGVDDEPLRTAYADALEELGRTAEAEEQRTARRRSSEG